MTTAPTSITLRQMTARWRTKVAEVLPQVERQLQKKFDSRSFHENGGKRRLKVYVPDSPILLNLRVWCLRYAVDLPFILFHLLSYYHRARRRDKQITTLGIQLPVLCGTRSREILEEMVQKTFPNGENFKAQRQKLEERFWNLKPIRHLEYQTTEGMVRAYRQAIRRRQGEVGQGHQYKRPWRGNPWR